MKTKTNVKKVAAVAVVGVALVAASIGLGAVAFPVENQVIVENKTIEYVDRNHTNTIQINATEEQLAQAFAEGEASVELPVFDDSLEVALCDRMMFDDMDECKEEVLAEDKAMKMALDLDTKELFDMLEDKGIVEDEDEVEIITVYDDFEDIEILKSSFDNDKYKFAYELKIEDLEEEDKMKVLVTVLVEDGEVELLKVEKQ